MSPLLPAARGFALLCCLLAFMAAGSAHAEDLPAFHDADVTAFVKDYGAFMERYAAIMKDYMAAVRANDPARYQADIRKSSELVPKLSEMQARALALQEKLKSDEKRKFVDFMEKCRKLLDNATK